MKRGVTQGSILVLTLFLLYINQLPVHIQESRMINFSDDINILITAEIN
jgi:hypothetical protein